MVRKSNESSASSIAPFLTKCYEMVDDESTDEVISWSDSSNSFIIRDMTTFTVQLLPKYFKHSNFSSFMRQLNIYGFRKIDSDSWEFANDGFVRGQKHLLSNIVRRKHPQRLDHHKSSQQIDKSAGPFEDSEKRMLLKEVESLKTNKNVLMQELGKLRQLHETTDSKVLLLRERIKGMENNQQQMLSFLVMAMQNPSFLVQLLKPKENNWLKPEAGKTMLQEVTSDGESAVSDRMIVRYQTWMDLDETSTPLLTQKLSSDDSLDSDISFEKVKELFVNIDFLKMPVDTLPDIPADEMLKQLLLAPPFPENVTDADMDGQEPTDSRVELEPTLFGTQQEHFHTFESLAAEMENSQHMDMETTDRLQNLDLLTQQLGHLIAKTND